MKPELQIKAQVKEALTTDGNESVERLEYELQASKDVIKLYEDGQEVDAIVLKMAEGAVTKLSESHSTALELLAKAKSALYFSFMTISYSKFNETRLSLNLERINETLTSIEQFLENNK